MVGTRAQNNGQENDAHKTNIVDNTEQARDIPMRFVASSYSKTVLFCGKAKKRPIRYPSWSCSLTLKLGEIYTAFV